MGTRARRAAWIHATPHHFGLQITIEFCVRMQSYITVRLQEECEIGQRSHHEGKYISLLVKLFKNPKSMSVSYHGKHGVSHSQSFLHFSGT